MKHAVEGVLRKEKMRKLFLFLGILIPVFVSAQVDIPIGDWRTHFSYWNGKALAVGASNVYCSSGNGFFSVDRGDLSITRLSKIDGFSDVNISVLGLDPTTGLLVIGYRNGNIDLVDGNEITNIDLIKEASLSTGKEYSHVLFEGNLAYLSAEFGVTILDLGSKSIRETILNIGAGGASLAVNSAVIQRDSIFLATEEGILGADVNSNLLDFNNWLRYGLAQGAPEQPYEVIDLLNGKIIAGVDGTGLYQFDGSMWSPTSFGTTKSFVSSSENPQGILVCLEDEIIQINSDFSTSTIASPSIIAPTQAILDPSGKVWYTDQDGLIRFASGADEKFLIGGPLSESPVRVEYTGNEIITFAQARDAQGDPLRRELGFDLFKDGIWVNYNRLNTPNAISIPEFMDITDVSYQSQTQSYLFSSYGYGLMQWDGSEDFVVIDENTPGSPLENSDPPGRNTIITSLDGFNIGVWMSNYDVSRSVHLLEPGEDWTSFTPVFNQSRNALQVLTVFDLLWLRTDPEKGGGAIAFDPATQTEVIISDVFGQGDLPSRNVNDIALDKDGQVWIATDLGMVFFPNPFAVFDGDLSNSFPIFENRELLRDERITALEFDGGNRIWIGTEDGVWLFSENTDQLIHNFTEDNSPLLSNEIWDIEIDERSGEVFFATSAGLISFRSTATREDPQQRNVKIFPNPVRRNFEGQVGISGLAENVIVKITDVTGKLVKETRANGGTATWDVADFSGNRAKTGIYLVFSSSFDGEDTYIGKIAVLE